MKMITKTIEVPDNAATGKAMRTLRKTAGKSLRQVAKSLGFSAAYISDVELGRRGWSKELVDGYVEALKIKSPNSKGEA